MPTIKVPAGTISFPGFDKPIAALPKGDSVALDFGKFSMSGRINNAHVGGLPVEGFRFMRVRHKATGRAAIAMPMEDGLMAVQFDNLPAMGLLATGWHLYPRHHFKRRRR